MTAYIAYYRVSTDKQGRSGLGLDAQRAAVTVYLAGRGDLLAEFTKIESGKRSDRPQLAEALAQCRKQKATLIIAKLDRLVCNVAFIANLMESGVAFVTCDMPEANCLTLHILAAVAEHEREMISTCTKDALAAAKQRGTRLGNSSPAASLEHGRQAIAVQLNAHRAGVRPLAEEMRGAGLSLRGIARELNRRSIPTAHGRQWEAATVRGLFTHAQ